MTRQRYFSSAKAKKKYLEEECYNKYKNEDGEIPEDRMEDYLDEMDAIEGQYDMYLEQQSEKDW